MKRRLQWLHVGVRLGLVSAAILVLAACDWGQSSQTDGSGGGATALGALQDVVVAGIPMDSTFHPETTQYNGRCAYERTTIQFTVTLDEDGAPARLNGTDVFSGQTHTTNLSLGDNTFEIQDSETTYTFSIARNSVSYQLGTPCPNYPIPGNHGDEISENTISEKMIVEEGIIKEYHPYLAGCAADRWDYGNFGKEIDPEQTIVKSFGYDPSWGLLGTVNQVTLVMGGGDWQDAYELFEESSAPIITLYSFPLPLVVGGVLVAYEGVLVTAHWDLGMWNPVASYTQLFSNRSEAAEYRQPDGTIPVYDTPRLRRIRYWECLMSNTIGSGSVELSAETTWGVARTETQFFLEAQVDLEVDPMDWLDLSATVAEITTEGFSESVTLTESTTERVNRTAESVPGATSTTAILWQLVEEFHIVDSEGNLFSDPFYELDTDRSPVKLVNPLEIFAISTVPFF